MVFHCQRNQYCYTVSIAPYLWFYALKGHSSQVFHSWLKSWNKPKKHFQQLKSFYVFPFSKYCSLKWIINQLLESLLTFIEKQLFYSSKQLLCFATTLPQNIYWESGACSNFLKFGLIGNPGKLFRGKKSLSRGNLICYISETEGRWKFKFDEVNLQICQNFSREHPAKNFRPECPFKCNNIKLWFYISLLYNINPVQQN